MFPTYFVQFNFKETNPAHLEHHRKIKPNKSRVCEDLKGHKNHKMY